MISPGLLRGRSFVSFRSPEKFGKDLGLVLAQPRGVSSINFRANYSNRGWREKIFENMFFEAERRGKLFQMKVLGAAIDSDKFSSKSELSSRFFGRLKFSALFE